MVSVIIPDTALTEMTVREAAATHHSQILSFIYQPRSNKELLICIDLFSSFPPDWKEESKWPFLVARQQNELWMPKTVPSVTSDPPNRGDSVCPYRAGPPTASPRRCASRSSACTDTAGRRRSQPLWTAEKITWHDTFCFSKWNQTALLFSLLSSSGTVHAGLELRQSAQVSCWFETISLGPQLHSAVQGPQIQQSKTPVDGEKDGVFEVKWTDLQLLTLLLVLTDQQNL